LSDRNPIETVYNGYRFRSRLEARWAVFFDALGVRYDYEREGFDLGEHGWYLPDFWLPREECWVEIKPEGFFYDPKYEAFAGTEQTLLHVVGRPWPGRYGMVLYDGLDPEHTIWGSDPMDPLVFALDRKIPGVLWVTSESASRSLTKARIDHDKPPLSDSPPLEAAYAAASQARFEHGENPKGVGR